MESLIHAFGIDAKLIVVQIINFTVLAGILTYLLYKPVLKMLADREAKIKQGLEDAKLAGEAREKAEDERKEIVGAAHQEAEAVAARSAASAKEKAEEIMADANGRAEGVIKTAMEQGENIRTEALKKSETEIAKMAVLAAEAVLKEKNS